MYYNQEINEGKHQKNEKISHYHRYIFNHSLAKADIWTQLGLGLWSMAGIYSCTPVEKAPHFGSELFTLRKGLEEGTRQKYIKNEWSREGWSGASFLLVSQLKNKRTLRLKSGKFKMDKRNYFFTKYTIKLWNSLPQEVTETKHLARVKQGLNIYIDNKTIQSYNS